MARLTILSGSGSIAASGSMQNAVYYLGPGPAYYSGPMSDVPVKASASRRTTGYAPHMANGAFAGRRVGARWAAQTWGNVYRSCERQRFDVVAGE